MVNIRLTLVDRYVDGFEGFKVIRIGNKSALK